MMCFEISSAVERLKLSAKHTAGVVLYSTWMEKTGKRKEEARAVSDVQGMRSVSALCCFFYGNLSFA